LSNFGLVVKRSNKSGSLDMSMVSNEVIFESPVWFKCFMTEWTLDRGMKDHLFLVFNLLKGKGDGMYVPAFSW